MKKDEAKPEASTAAPDLSLQPEAQCNRKTVSLPPRPEGRGFTETTMIDAKQAADIIYGQDDDLAAAQHADVLALQRQTLDDLYRFYIDGRCQTQEVWMFLIEERAERIAAALGLSTEWKKRMRLPTGATVEGTGKSQYRLRQELLTTLERELGMEDKMENIDFSKFAHIPTEEVVADITDTENEAKQFEAELHILRHNLPENRVKIYMTEGHLSQRRDLIKKLQEILEHRKVSPNA